MFCMALTAQAEWDSAVMAVRQQFIAQIWLFYPRQHAPKHRSLQHGTDFADWLVLGSGLLLLSVAPQRPADDAGAGASTALIGYGQALIVNSFYRIGMRDIRACDAGAGSAILAAAGDAGAGAGRLGSVLNPGQARR